MFRFCKDLHAFRRDLLREEGIAMEYGRASGLSIPLPEQSRQIQFAWYLSLQVNRNHLEWIVISVTVRLA